MAVLCTLLTSVTTTRVYSPAFPTWLCALMSWLCGIQTPLPSVFQLHSATKNHQRWEHRRRERGGNNSSAVPFLLQGSAVTWVASCPSRIQLLPGDPGTLPSVHKVPLTRVPHHCLRAGLGVVTILTTVPPPCMSQDHLLWGPGTQPNPLYTVYEISFLNPSECILFYSRIQTGVAAKALAPWPALKSSTW